MPTLGQTTSVARQTPDSLFSLVSRACRRVVFQRTFREASLALSITFAGLALLLALGSDWFSPYWLAVFAVAGLGAGAWRWMRSRPSPYEVVQRLDAEWATNDQISTAYYFSQAGSRVGGPLREQQFRMASAAAQGDLGAALPFRVPSTAWALLTAVLVALALFGVRYGTQLELSFKPPLAPLEQLALWHALEDEILSQRSFPESVEKGEALRVESRQPDAATVAPAAPPDGARKADQPGAPAGPTGEDGAAPEVDGLSPDEEYGDDLAASDRDTTGEMQGPEGGEEGMSPPSGNEQEGTANPETSATAEPSNDLLSRLRDALKDMMSALRSDPQSGQKGRESSGQETSAASDQQENSGQAGEEGGQQSQNEGGTPQEGAQSGEAQQSAESGISKSSAQSGDNREASSSAGAGEGSRQMQEAAQQAALNEITRLFSQRSDEMTGEAIIETESSRQDLQTPYQPVDAAHQDRGGIVSRDEIPVEYRNFIQTYFENLRKSKE